MPKIVYETSYGKLQYDFTKSVDELTERLDENSVADAAAGLASSGFSTDMSAKLHIYHNRNGTKCVTVGEVKLFVGFKQPTIYVANKYKPGTCEFDVIMRHEKAHIAIYKTALDYFNLKFYAAAEKIIKSIRPEIVRNESFPDKYYKAMFDKLFTGMNKMFDFYRETVDAEHGKLDNTVSYKLDDYICQ